LGGIIIAETKICVNGSVVSHSRRKSGMYLFKWGGEDENAIMVAKSKGFSLRHARLNDKLSVTAERKLRSSQRPSPHYLYTSSALMEGNMRVSPAAFLHSYV
jgi:hypothetical protein